MVLDQLEPNRSVFNIPSVFGLEGRLDIPALERSFDEIVRRHEALRTTFSMIDGEAVQIISPSLVITIPGLSPSRAVLSKLTRKGIAFSSPALSPAGNVRWSMITQPVGSRPYGPRRCGVQS